MQQVWDNSVCSPRPRCVLAEGNLLGSRKCLVNDRILPWIVWSFFFLPSRLNLRVDGNECRDFYRHRMHVVGDVDADDGSVRSTLSFFPPGPTRRIPLQSPSREREGAKKEPPVEFPD